MDEISEKGEFLWKPNQEHLQQSLKDLMFISLIKRKPTYGNVFLPTELGSKAISWNQTAKILNS